MTSTDLIKRNGNGLPAPAEISQQLSDLRERGDTDTLLEVSRQAAVYQEYEKRQDAKARANTYGRIKVMAESHIGLMDLEMHPQAISTDLVISGEKVGRYLRGEWRILGAASRIGYLDPALDALERGEETIGTHALVREFRYLGVGWLSVDLFQKRYAALKRAGDWKIQDVCQRSGLSSDTIYTYVMPGRRDRAPHFVALLLADALGIDPQRLRPMYKKGSGRKPGRQMPRPKKLVGGRLDQAYVLVRRALQELDSAAGERGRWGTAEAYEHLYKAEEIIGKAMKRAT